MKSGDSNAETNKIALIAPYELSWVYTDADVSRPVAGPVQTQIQILPLHEIGWENFERLCVRLGQRQTDAEHCQAYGVPGQEQFGIDLYIRQKSNRRYTVWQCKCCETLNPGDLRAIVDKFLAGHWPAQTDAFCLATSAELSRAELAEEEKIQAARLGERNIAFIPIDLNALSGQLKNHPDLVGDFFGFNWVTTFCGPEAAARLKQRRKLDPAQVSELKNKLRQFYTQQFQSVDPGLPAATFSGKHEHAPLSLSQRYIPLDVFEVRSINSLHLFRQAGRETTGQAVKVDGKSGGANVQGRINKEEIRTRIPLFQWLSGCEKTLLIGEPGSGKSASLRFLLLDLLSKNPSEAQLAAKWGNRLPVWVPFAVWTQMVTNQRPNCGLGDVLKDWLHNIGIPDSAVDLVLLALDDERLVLFVDGLDEWSNEAAAGTVLALLNTFVQATRVPVIATTRPLGYTRLAPGLGAWRTVELAGLSESQKAKLAQRWFAYHLGTAAGEDRIGSVVSQRVDQFLGELRRDPALARVGEIPLLLSGLIGLSLEGWQLPRSRFLAYEALTKRLVETHRKFREAATMKHNDSLPLNIDEIYRALAKLAFFTQESPGAVSVSRNSARETLAEHLAERLGKPRSDILEKVDELLAVSETSLGILVEKNSDEIGFIHRIFQEFLAARHLHYQPISEQNKAVFNLVSNPTWHEVLLCLCHLTNRENEVDGFLDQIEGAALEPLESFHREQLLAEIAFGDLHASRTRSRALAKETFHCIETHWWLPLRRRLLDTVIDGLNSSALRETVIEKLAQWYPCAIGFKFGVYDALARWPFEEATVAVMMHGLRENDEVSKRPAAYSLAKYAGGREGVGQQLLALSKSPVYPEVSSACLISLSMGWPEMEGVAAILEDAIRSRDFELRLAGFLGLVNIGRSDSWLRDALLAIVGEGSFRQWTWESEIVAALLKGWPADNTLKNIALRSFAEHWQYPGQLSWKIACSFLIRGYPQDDQVATILANELNGRDGLHFFGSGGDLDELSGFAGHPKVVNALENCLKRDKDIPGNTLYHAARLTHSALFKAELLRKLKEPDCVSFWIVDALIDVWGAEDSEVATALLEFASNSKVEDDSLGETILRLPLAPDVCHRRLLAALSGQNSGRRFSVLRGLGKQCVGRNDENALSIALAAIKRPIWQDESSDRRELILNFNTFPVVKEFARAELRQRNAQVTAVAEAYANDARMRELVRCALIQLPTGLRFQIVERLEGLAPTDEAALKILSAYDNETDEGVKIAGACAYFAGVHSRGLLHSEDVERLKATLGAVGHDTSERRQAALLGLAALGRLDSAVSAIDPFQKEPVKIRFEGGTQINHEVVRRVAKFWPAIMRDFGDSVWDRVPLTGGFLGEMLDFVDDPETFEILVARWESSRKSEDGTPNAIRALARKEPKSERVRRLCTSILLGENGRGYWGHVAEAIAAAEILGEQFGGDSDLQSLLESHVNEPEARGGIIFALLKGWPESPVLDSLPASDRPVGWQLPHEIQMASRRLNPEDLLNVIRHILACLRGGIWDFLPNAARPLLLRFSNDSQIVALGEHRLLHGANPDELATLLKLISRSKGLNPQLVSLAKAELTRQVAVTGLTELGCDLLGSRVAPVAHGILDVLEGND